MPTRVPVLVLALLCIPLAGCAGSGGLSVDVTNSEQTQDGETTYTARFSVRMDAWSDRSEETLDVPESSATLTVDPSLSEGTVDLVVEGPHGDQRLAENLDASSSQSQQQVPNADGTWSIAIEGDGATGDLRVELS